MQITNYAFDERIDGIFCPRRISLPTPATLHGCKFLVQLGIVWHVCPAHFWLFNFRFDINGFKRLCGMTLLIMCIKEG